MNFSTIIQFVVGLLINTPLIAFFFGTVWAVIIRPEQMHTVEPYVVGGVGGLAYLVFMIGRLRNGSFERENKKTFSNSDKVVLWLCLGLFVGLVLLGLSAL